MKYKIGQYIRIIFKDKEVIALIIGSISCGYLVSDNSKIFGLSGTTFSASLAMAYNVPEKYWKETKVVFLVYHREVLGLSKKPKCIACSK